jgi:hypothetical protein
MLLHESLFMYNLFTNPIAELLNSHLRISITRRPYGDSMLLNRPLVGVRKQRFAGEREQRLARVTKQRLMGVREQILVGVTK